MERLWYFLALLRNSLQTPQNEEIILELNNVREERRQKINRLNQVLADHNTAMQAAQWAMADLVKRDKK